MYILPLRHPFITARSVVTLDRISGGRVTLGVGVGWLEEEFAAAGASFHDRGKRTDEIMVLLRRLWTEDVIESTSGSYRFGPVRFEPKPLQKPTIPIAVGGHSRPALRRAGRLGDGWVAAGGVDFETLGEMITVVEDARREAGREEEPFEITSGIGRDYESIRRAEDLGVTRCNVGPVPGSSSSDEPGSRARIRREDFIEFVERYGEEVISRMT